ncbi:MAG: hypothetical protein U0795_15165 [Pirellulales bacterium]
MKPTLRSLCCTPQWPALNWSTLNWLALNWLMMCGCILSWLLSVVPLSAQEATALQAEAIGQVAADLLREGKTAEAVASFDQGAAAAAKLGRVDLAYSWLCQAAAIVEQQQAYRDAAARYQSLALEYRDEPSAGSMHLRGLACLAEVARNDGKVLDEYQAGLQRHLTTWSRGAASDRARIWLAELLTARAQNTDAIEVLKGVPPGSADYRRALELLQQSVRQQLRQLTDPEAQQRLALSMIRFWENQTFAPQDPSAARPAELPADGPAAPTRRWTDDQLWTLLASARLRVGLLRQNSQRVSEVLDEILAGDEPDAAWRSQAHLVAALAYAYQANWDRVAQHLQQLPSASVAEVLEGAETLGQLGLELPADRRPAVAQVMTGVLDRTTEPSEAEAALRARWWECRAQAARLASDPAAAKRAYDAALVAGPDDLPLKMRYARWLAESDFDLEAAQQLWRTVMETTPRYGDIWWQAKYESAALLVRQGKIEQADRMIRQLEILHPDLGGTQLRTAFQRLQQSLRSKTQP